MNRKIILIGGTSHTGKSSLAQTLATSLNIPWRSTDSLAKHPGRPWKKRFELIPIHVQEHYDSLSIPELIDDVLAHYQGLAPKIQSLIVAARDKNTGLIIEGSALLPVLLSELRDKHTTTFCLTASPELLQKRIHSSSQYEHKSKVEKQLITTFLQRALAFDSIIRKETISIPLIDVTEYHSIDLLRDFCLQKISSTRN